MDEDQGFYWRDYMNIDKRDEEVRNIVNSMLLSLEQFGFLPGKKIIEFGCGMGHFTAMCRKKGIDCIGFDVDKYAIKNCVTGAIGYVNIMGKNSFSDIHADIIFAKDVFEHIEENKLNQILQNMSSISSNLFICVPISSDGKIYNALRSEKDITHKIWADEWWWIRKILSNGWKLLWCGDRLNGWKPIDINHNRCNLLAFFERNNDESFYWSAC